MKVFIFDPLWLKLVDEKLKNILVENNIEVIVISDVKPLHETQELFKGSEERLLCLNPDYVSWKLHSEDYAKIPNLKAILIASTGFEWIDQSSANDNNIPICNIRNFSTDAVAEWAILMAQSLARQLPRLMKDGFPLDYDADYLKYRGINLRSKVAGIIGLGNIGSAIAERCKGLGMSVIYYSKNSEDSRYQKVEIDDLLARADVIFPTLAKNDETLNFITNDMLRAVKPGAIISDITHGLINQDIALEMINNNQLFGYGFESKTEQYTSYDGNVWSAPAYAWATYESMYNSESKLVENIVAASKGDFPNRINL